MRGQTKALILILNFLIMKKIFLLRAATTTISGQHLYDQSSESQVGFPLQKLLQQKMHNCEFEVSKKILIHSNRLHFTVKKSPERLTKIAMADYISSHPGGVLGKVFN